MLKNVYKNFTIYKIQYSNQNISDDFGFLYLKARSDGKTAKQLAGGYIGIVLDIAPKNVDYSAIGYPFFDGEYNMWSDLGKGLLLVEEFISKFREHPNLNYGGMSGGPWLLCSNITKLNGVTSGSKLDFEKSNSAYFGHILSDFMNLLGISNPTSNNPVKVPTKLG